jgi:F0F1-type ATP synthase delta subunit
VAHKQAFVLPAALYAKRDVGRLLREIEKVDAAKSAKPKEQSVSSLLQSVIDANSGADKTVTLAEVAPALKQLYDKAPSIHISFAAAPSPEFLSKLVSWFRKEVDPYVLLKVGLQPTIGAGCLLRTPNKFFDMTMRKRFAEKKPVLEAQLRGQNA